jgi:hypothetical protein
MGINEEPHIVFVNVVLFEQFQIEIKQLLTKFKYVFAWSYKKLKGILISICEHKIELITDTHLIK